LLGGVDGGIGGVVDGCSDGEVACWGLGRCCAVGFGVGRLVGRYLVLRWDSGCLVMAALVYWFWLGIISLLVLFVCLLV
jgi:hypothetical protein